ncbi:MAG: hypothetical protein M3275_07480 [Thermoproteota archaeon]|nr:hypothetical protein [Thermoproteota archaeon]
MITVGQIQQQCNVDAVLGLGFVFGATGVGSLSDLFGAARLVINSVAWSILTSSILFYGNAGSIWE